MKIKNIKDAAKKRDRKAGQIIDIKKVAKKKETYAKQIKKLEEVRIIARKMGIDTRNATMTELIRAIQRAEGNQDCYSSEQVLTCGQTNCYWREVCDSV
jgi:hypothetical protein